MEKACSLLNRHLQDVIEEWLWYIHYQNISVEALDAIQYPLLLIKK